MDRVECIIGKKTEFSHLLFEFKSDSRLKVNCCCVLSPVCSCWKLVMSVLGYWSVEEPVDNPLQNDLGLVLKVIVSLRIW